MIQEKAAVKEFRQFAEYRILEMKLADGEELTACDWKLVHLMRIKLKLKEEIFQLEASYGLQIDELQNQFDLLNKLGSPRSVKFG